MCVCVADGVLMMCEDYVSTERDGSVAKRKRTSYEKRLSANVSLIEVVVGRPEFPNVFHISSTTKR